MIPAGRAFDQGLVHGSNADTVLEYRYNTRVTQLMGRVACHGGQTRWLVWLDPAPLWVGLNIVVQSFLDEANEVSCWFVPS